MDMKSVWKALDKISNPKIRAFIENALQEQTEQEKGCEYCKRGYDLSTGNACEPSLYIQGNTLLALRYDEPDSEAEIHYCPMCGKRLN